MMVKCPMIYIYKLLKMAMRCYICEDTIMSKIHLEQCNTVMMWQSQTFSLDSFKNAMTYGLCGCSVAVFISNRKVYMIHVPSADNVFLYILRNYDVKSGNTILLKVPADSYKWNKPQDKIWDNLKHLPVEFSIYSLSQSIGDEFNSTLYVKMLEDGIYYTGLWGEWKLLLPQKSQQLPMNVDASTSNIPT